ncbi:hypothetical protein WN51_03509 [Melipona quadrifasciata]|uniref:Uncharacterized protein n=1 Tax=Melipona quadrifasciata TaxID=166423 RepID=A0A0M8ZU98_9HYME|nr:hypothetical protein WN51_03509 [Melipona quadrifasciata]
MKKFNVAGIEAVAPTHAFHRPLQVACLNRMPLSLSRLAVTWGGGGGTGGGSGLVATSRLSELELWRRGGVMLVVTFPCETCCFASADLPAEWSLPLPDDFECDGDKFVNNHRVTGSDSTERKRKEKKKSGASTVVDKLVEIIAKKILQSSRPMNTDNKIWMTISISVNFVPSFASTEQTSRGYFSTSAVEALTFKFGTPCTWKSDEQSVPRDPIGRKIVRRTDNGTAEFAISKVLYTQKIGADRKNWNNPVTLTQSWKMFFIFKRSASRLEIQASRNIEQVSESMSLCLLKSNKDYARARKSLALFININELTSDELCKTVEKFAMTDCNFLMENMEHCIEKYGEISKAIVDTSDAMAKSALFTKMDGPIPWPPKSPDFATFTCGGILTQKKKKKKRRIPHVQWKTKTHNLGEKGKYLKYKLLLIVMRANNSPTKIIRKEEYINTLKKE